MASKSSTAMPFPAMGETLDFMQKMWGMSGMPTPGNLASMAARLPQQMPSMIAPTVDIEELDKRIADLRAVEQWLELNASMLRTTIQTLEVQRATIATLKGISGAMMGSMFSQAPAPAPRPNPFAAPPSQPRPSPCAHAGAGRSTARGAGRRDPAQEEDNAEINPEAGRRCIESGGLVAHAAGSVLQDRVGGHGSAAARAEEGQEAGAPRAQEGLKAVAARTPPNAVLAEQAVATRGVPRHQCREQLSSGGAGLRPEGKSSDFSEIVNKRSPRRVAKARFGDGLCKRLVLAWTQVPGRPQADMTSSR